MAGITLAQAQTKLDEWIAADSAVANGQEYTTSTGRSLRRSDAATIRENIQFWDAKVRELDNLAQSGHSSRRVIRTRYVVPE